MFIIQQAQYELFSYYYTRENDMTYLGTAITMLNGEVHVQENFLLLKI